MPANSPTVRVCPNCDGFPVVAVSTTTRRLPDGTLPTLPAVCLHCSGTGSVPAPHPIRLTSVGR